MTEAEPGLESRAHFARALADAGFGFDEVDPIELRAFCGLSEYRRTTRNAPLFERGGLPAGLFLVAHGEYELALEGESNRRQIIRIADAGKLITEGLSPERLGCRVSCFARTDASAWRVDVPRLVATSRGSAPLALAITRVLAHRQARLLDLVFDLSLRGVEQRLAAFLIATAHHESSGDGPRGPVEISRQLPVQTIAEMLGTTRAEVTRAQASLQKAGLIEVTRDRIFIPDLSSLTRAR